MCSSDIRTVLGKSHIQSPLSHSACFSSTGLQPFLLLLVRPTSTSGSPSYVGTVMMKMPCRGALCWQSALLRVFSQNLTDQTLAIQTALPVFPKSKTFHFVLLCLIDTLGLNTWKYGYEADVARIIPHNTKSSQAGFMHFKRTLGNSIHAHIKQRHCS